MPKSFLITLEEDISTDELNEAINQILPLVTSTATSPCYEGISIAQMELQNLWNFRRGGYLDCRCADPTTNPVHLPWHKLSERQRENFTQGLAHAIAESWFNNNLRVEEYINATYFPGARATCQ